MADDNNIKLRLQVDTKDAKSSMTSFEQSINKAFSSSDNKVKKLGTQLNTTITKLKQYQAKAKEMETTKVPTEEYTNLKNKIDSVTKSYESAKKERDKLGNQRVFTTEYAGATDDVKNYSKSLEEARINLGKVQNAIDSGQQVDSSTYTLAEQAVDEYTTKLNEAIQTQVQLEESGQQYVPSQQYDEATAKVETYERVLDSANQQLRVMESTGRDATSAAEANPGVYNALQSNIRGCAIQAEIFVSQITESINKSFNLKSVTTGLKQAWTSFANTAKSAINKVSTYLKSKLKNSLTSTTTHHNKSFKSMLTTVLKYGFGIRSLFLLYKKLRTTVSTGLGEMAKDFEDVNATASELYNSWNTFKSSIISAFEPIYTYVVPALSSLLDYMTDVMNSLANFFANLTGASTYKKAIKQNNDYADSLSSTADSADEATEKLADYDELLVIDQDSDSDSSGSTDTWQWVETATEASEWADTIKDALTDWDFTEVGEKISSALITAMKSINWDKIYGYASNFGTGLATFLNGLISDDLFSTLGSTIAKALNTALTAVDAFATDFEWEELGDAISSGINAFIADFDIQLATDSFNKVAKGILSTLVSAIRGVEWDEVSQALTDAINGLDIEGIGEEFGELVNSIANAIYTLVSNTETWTALGQKIADGINGFFKGMSEIDEETGLNGWQALGESLTDTILGFGDLIITALDGVDWEAIGQAIVDFFKSISWSDIFAKAIELKGAIEDAIEGLLKGLGIDIGDVDLVVASIAGITLASLAKTAIASTLPAIIKAQCMSVVGGLGSVSLGTVAVTVLITATLGWQIGTKLYESASGHEVEEGFVEEIQDIIQGFGEDQIEFNLLDFIEFTISDSEGWYGKYAEWAGGLGDKLYDLLHKHIPGVIEEVGPAWEELVTGWWDTISSGFKDLVNWDELIELFDEQTWKDFWDALWGDIKDAFSIVGDWFKEKFGGAWDNIKNAWSTTKSWAQEKWSGIKDAFSTTNTWFKEKFSGAWDNVSGAFSSTSEFFGNTWDKIKDAFGSGTGITDWFSEKFGGAWEAIKNIFDGNGSEDGVTGFFSGIWDKIKDTWDSLGTSISDAIGESVKSGLNSIITFIEDTINDAIGIINGALGLIDAITPGTIELVDEIELPKFARGGVFDKSTLGIFGEAGTEAVVPLENNLQWLSKLSDMITETAIPAITQGLVLPMSEEFMKAINTDTSTQGNSLSVADIVEAIMEANDRTSSTSDNQPIVIQVDGKTVAQVVWNESEKRYKQTGLRPAYT